jgi:hypothetical protein
MKIVIPTYERCDDFKTIHFLEKNNIPKEFIYIFVANEEQKEKYILSIGNEYEIIVGVLGLVNQRNFITNYFSEGEIIISMDDDIEDLIHAENKPLIEWLEECCEYLKNSNNALLSINPSVNPFFFEQRKGADEPFKIGNYLCIGCFQIIKNDKSLMLSIDDFEDWERTLLFQNKYGANIRYNDVLVKTKYFCKNGGLATFRNKYTYLKNINKLIYKFSQSVSFTYKKLALDKHTLFPGLKFHRRPVYINLPAIELPKIDPSELSVLYCMLENISIHPKGEKSNRRGFPMGHRSATFGYTRARYGTRKNGKLYDLSSYSLKYPDIYEELLRIGNIFCPFKFTAIHVNKNVVCPKHLDSRNVGKSMLLSFGDYTGCKIVIEGKEYNTDCQPVIFDGSTLEHWNTNDLIGTKYSLVFFNGEMSD